MLLLLLLLSSNPTVLESFARCSLWCDLFIKASFWRSLTSGKRGGGLDVVRKWVSLKRVSNTWSAQQAAEERGRPESKPNPLLCRRQKERDDSFPLVGLFSRNGSSGQPRTGKTNDVCPVGASQNGCRHAPSIRRISTAESHAVLAFRWRGVGPPPPKKKWLGGHENHQILEPRDFPGRSWTLLNSSPRFEQVSVGHIRFTFFCVFGLTGFGAKTFWNARLHLLI